MNVDVELSGHLEDPTYNDWKVSNDCSLFPLSDEQKLYHFKDRIQAESVDDWDTTGIELVTLPIRPDNQLSFQEIQKYLTALRGSSESNHGIFTSKYAGFHVHKGFAKPSKSDKSSLLHIIQHLAYTLVQFEPPLVEFSPPYRV